MPKTKDAFALRDFDKKKILQRKYFASLKLPQEDDKSVLFFYQKTSADSFAVNDFDKLETIYSELREIAKKVVKYGNFLRRHSKRLEKCFFRVNAHLFSKENLVVEEVKKKSRRLNSLREKYYQIEATYFYFLCNFFDFFSEIYRETELEPVQINFPLRLKEARKAAGLTQRQMATKLGMTASGYCLYEKGEREPTIKTLARLSRTLKRSADWLLGLE